MSTTIAEQIEKLIMSEAIRRLEDLSTTGVPNIVAKKYFEVAEENEQLKESLKIANDATQVYRDQCEKFVGYNQKLEEERDKLKLEVENLSQNLKAYQLLSKAKTNDVMGILSSARFHDFFYRMFQKYLKADVGVSEREVKEEVARIFNL